MQTIAMLIVLLAIVVIMSLLINDEIDIIKSGIIKTHPEKTIESAFEAAFGCTGEWMMDYNGSNDKERYMVYVNSRKEREFSVEFKFDTESCEVIANKLFIDFRDCTNNLNEFLDRVYYAPESFK